MDSSLKKGDTVRIINYGHLIWMSESMHDMFVRMGDRPMKAYSVEDGVMWIDIEKRLIGKIGVIDEVIWTQGIPQYSLSGLDKQDKVAWYNQNQLELVK